MTAASRLRGSREGWAELANRVPIGPRQPRAGCDLERVEMPLERDQIVERLDAIQLARVNEGHKQIPDLRTIRRLIEKGCLAVKNRALQGPLDEIGIQGRSRDLEKPSQGYPVLQQVPDGLAKSGVWFDPMLVELRAEPGVERVHRRPTVRLMERQPRLRGQAALARLRVEAVDIPERLEDVTALLGEIRGDIDDVPARVTEAVGEHDREGLRDIAGQRVTHLDRRLEPGRPVGEHGGEIFAGMPAARDIERDAMAVAGRGHDPRGKDAGASRRDLVIVRDGRGRRRRWGWLEQAEH